MITAVSKLQFSLDLEPGLTQQFRTLKQVVAAVVYGSRMGLLGVASHCDLSPSALSRMLNENEDDPRHLPVDLLPQIIQVTGDLRPIHWLNAKFLLDDATKQRAIVGELAAMMPQITSMLATLQKGAK